MPSEYKTITVDVTSQKYEDTKYTVNLPIPGTCPVCDKGSDPKFIAGTVFGDLLSVLLFCNRDDCKQGFVAYYKIDIIPHTKIQNAKLITCSPKKQKFEEFSFSENIEKLSPRFVKVCNQALRAHNLHLDEISGPGFRKALEILVKDYCIKELNCDKSDIEKTFLQNCIEKYIPDSDLKSILKAATENGNDEVHYQRKYEASDVEYLMEFLWHSVRQIDFALSAKDARAFLATKKPS